MAGRFLVERRIKDSATPIDNITKFAWYDDDYEDVETWVEYSEAELNIQREIEMSKLHNDKLNELFELIHHEIEPSDKLGFDWDCTYIGELCVMKEYVKREEDEPSGDGSPWNPFSYTVGMAVEETMWYTDGEYIWECIKSGTPVDFSDSEYFDIIVV